MKKPFLLLAQLFVVCHSFFGQDVKTAVFPNGTEIDYQILSNKAGEIPKLNVWLFDLNARGTFTTGWSVIYSMPDYFLTKVHLGLGAGKNNFGKFSIENNVFFKSFSKEKTYPVTLKAISDRNTTTKFKVKESLEKRTQLGGRLGYLIGDFRTDIYQFNSNIANVNELSIGFSCLTTKYIKLKRLTGNKPKTGFKFSRTNYFAELTYNHNVKSAVFDEQLKQTVYGDVSNSVGYRIGIDGQSGGRFGISYMFGFEKPPVKNKLIDFYFGFGCYLSFL